METQKKSINEQEINGKEVTSQSGNEPKQQKEKLPLPDRDTVGDWCKRDLKSAIYFLDYLYTKPELLKIVVDAMYEDAVRGTKLDS